MASPKGKKIHKHHKAVEIQLKRERKGGGERFLKIVSVLLFTVLTEWVSGMSDVAQSCPTLCDPMDCGLPRSSVHGAFQARVLEWVAIAFFGTVTVTVTLFQTLFPIRLLQNIEKRSLCYTAGPCWLSILNIVVCT